MQTTTNEMFGHTHRDVIVAESNSPAYQSYQILHFAFVVLPLLAGLDKFTNWFVSWDAYLAPAISRVLPVSDHQFMIAVGVVEILVGLFVAAKPKIGGIVVAAWMLAIIVNLFLAQSFYDVALRDFGLLLAALAMSRLSLDFERPKELDRSKQLVAP